jgi:hypothetical protein
MESEETQDFDLELEEEAEAEQPEKDWKAEALKYKSMAKRYKTKAETKTESPKEKPINNDNPSPIKPMDILRDETFALYREGYENDEIELIIRNGGRKILEDENSPITLGLRAKREQRQAEKAASQANGNAELSEVERKYTNEQLANMSAKELEEILPKAD